ncbi:sin3 histone deacetylase corepressor complex component sds3 [Anaeramoeba flamelloides]|uniref:Sin3 histone deacetylase corepressor complex component sds3 n=1 Tax=Anaeramoeba flamelloides TaxID=1746091 RepID=A0AAV7Z3B5_9EUKA|nr:sin3 histone deacetylase corepressor complex component sds3 [Anaeramoeba flamelloides]
MTETSQTTTQPEPNNEANSKEPSNDPEEKTKIEKEFSQALKRQRSLYESSVSISRDVRKLAQKVNSVEYFNLISLKRELHKHTQKKFQKQAEQMEKMKENRIQDSEEWYQFQLSNLERLIEEETIKINKHFEKASKQLGKELMDKIKEGNEMLSKGTHPQKSFYIFDKTIEKRNKNNNSDLGEIESKVHKVIVGLKEQEISKDIEMIQKNFSEKKKNKNKEKKKKKIDTINVEIEGLHLVYDKYKFFNGSGVYLKTEINKQLFGIITNITKDYIIIKHTNEKESKILLSQLRKHMYLLAPITTLL